MKVGTLPEGSSSAQREALYRLVKNHLVHKACWSEVADTVAGMVGDLPLITNEEKRSRFVLKLKELHAYLKEHTDADDLEFLQEEIDRHDMTRQLTTSKERDDGMNPELIARYAGDAYASEGIVGIHLALTYEQCSKLSRGVWELTGDLRAYVSREVSFHGKIVSMYFENRVEMVLASLAHSKKLQAETGQPLLTRVFLFGQTYEKTKYVITKNITEEFYLYRFTTDAGQDFIVCSLEHKPIGDYIVSGVTVRCDDLVSITNGTFKLQTKIPFLIAQKIMPKAIAFQSHQEFFARTAYLGITMRSFFEFPFLVCRKQKKDGASQYVVQQHPEWFQWLVWAWLCHAPQGVMQPFPLHLMICGPKGTGKSTMLDGIFAISRETQAVFSGKSSKMKGLTVSFKDKPIKPGYLLRCNRFAFIDEFFGVVAGLDDTHRLEALASMNDLLEHRKRELSSGMGRIPVDLHARILATTNPPTHAGKGMNGIIRYTDESFLSRWLVILQHPEGDMVQLFRRSVTQEPVFVEPLIDTNDWVSLLDYLWTFDSSWDEQRVVKIYEQNMMLLSDKLLSHYEARHLHHLQCLMDGVIKARCMMRGDNAFTALETDYAIVEHVWRNVIKTWIDTAALKDLPFAQRLQYLPSDSQYLYGLLANLERGVGVVELKELTKETLPGEQFMPALIILESQGMLVQQEGLIRALYPVTKDHLEFIDAKIDLVGER